MGQSTATQSGDRSFYDGRGRRILAIDAQNNATRFVYDAANQLIAQIDPKGKMTRFRYDQVGRQIERIETLNGQDSITRTEYDKVGNVSATTDPLGNRTEYQYDALNRRVRVLDVTWAAQRNMGMHFTEMSYDRVGNLLSLTDSQTNVTQYRYDALNRLIAETVTLTSGTEVSRSYEYDASGNRTKATDRNGRVRNFAFDGLNRQIQETWFTGTTENRRFTSSYDAANQLRRISDGFSGYEFDYDAQGRIRWVDNSGTLNTPRVRFTYGYDALSGNLTSVEEMINGLAGARTEYGYDASDRMVRIAQSGGTAQTKQVLFGYNHIGQLASIQRSVNSGQMVIGTSYDYDALDRLVSLRHVRTEKGTERDTDTPLASYTYGYDGLTSRIRQITDRTGTTTFSYDAIHQLTGADRAGTANDETYTYDRHGNRANYQTERDNRLRSDGTYSYTYDNEGNLIRQTGAGLTREFEWDHRNQLIRVRDLNGGGVETRRVDYTYDTHGQRLAKIVDLDGAGSQAAVTTRFVYDRNHVALEFTGTSATPSQRYLYGVQTDQILAQESSGVTTWHLADHLGSVRELVSSGGAIVNQYTYDSFGKLIGSPTGTVDTRYRYTGREWDGETGLYYYRARYYDANVGRFISQDPIGFAAGDTNLYRYVGNNPTNGIDPSGKFTVSITYLQLVPGIPKYSSYYHAEVLVSDDTPGNTSTRRYYAGRQNDARKPDGSIDYLLEGALVAQGLFNGNGHSIQLPGQKPFSYGSIVRGNFNASPEPSPLPLQQVYHCSNKCADNKIIEDKIRSVFVRAERQRLQYDVIRRNSNSVAFQALEEGLGIRPQPNAGGFVKAPGWEINPFTDQVSSKAKPIGSRHSTPTSGAIPIRTQPVYW